MQDLPAALSIVICCAIEAHARQSGLSAEKAPAALLDRGTWFHCGALRSVGAPRTGLSGRAAAGSWEWRRGHVEVWELRVEKEAREGVGAGIGCGCHALLGLPSSPSFALLPLEVDEEASEVL